MIKLQMNRKEIIGAIEAIAKTSFIQISGVKWMFETNDAAAFSAITGDDLDNQKIIILVNKQCAFVEEGYAHYITYHKPSMGWTDEPTNYKPFGDIRQAVQDQPMTINEALSFDGLMVDQDKLNEVFTGGFSRITGDIELDSGRNWLYADKKNVDFANPISYRTLLECNAVMDRPCGDIDLDDEDYK